MFLSLMMLCLPIRRRIQHPKIHVEVKWIGAEVRYLL